VERSPAPASRRHPAIALFDPSGTAHSGNAVRGLARASAAAGIDTTVYAHPDVRPEVLPDGTRWHDRSAPGELWTPEARRAHRAVIVEAVDDFAPRPGAAFCDLGLDRTVASRGRPIDASPQTVFTIHRLGALDRVPVRWRRRLQRPRAKNRAELRQLGRAGARFVVHSDAVGERLGDFVPPANIVRLGWPVTGADSVTLGSTWRPRVEDRTLLLAGSIRAEKGFVTFLRAAAASPEFDRLVMPGRIPPVYRDLAIGTDPRIEVWDRWLTETEYLDAFAASALVVLPYDAQYTERGTTSSVLLEAMAAGRPVFASTAIAHLLPPGYEGAIVVDTGDETSIRDGLRRAFAEIDTLEHAAMTTGRAFIAEHHTYERYVDGLANAGGLSTTVTGPGR
jgi:glycosyltransferase involved in cell wall biosynthesis